MISSFSKSNNLSDVSIMPSGEYSDDSKLPAYNNPLNALIGPFQYCAGAFAGALAVSLNTISMAGSYMHVGSVTDVNWGEGWRTKGRLRVSGNPASPDATRFTRTRAAAGIILSLPAIVTLGAMVNNPISAIIVGASSVVVTGSALFKTFGPNKSASHKTNQAQKQRQHKENSDDPEHDKGKGHERNVDKKAEAGSKKEVGADKAATKGGPDSSSQNKQSRRFRIPTPKIKEILGAAVIGIVIAAGVASGGVVPLVAGVVFSAAVVTGLVIDRKSGTRNSAIDSRGNKIKGDKKEGAKETVEDEKDHSKKKGRTKEKEASKEKEGPAPVGEKKEAKTTTEPVKESDKKSGRRFFKGKTSGGSSLPSQKDGAQKTGRVSRVAKSAASGKEAVAKKDAPAVETTPTPPPPPPPPAKDKPQGRLRGLISRNKGASKSSAPKGMRKIGGSTGGASRRARTDTAPVQGEPAAESIAVESTQVQTGIPVAVEVDPTEVKDSSTLPVAQAVDTNQVEEVSVPNPATAAVVSLKDHIDALNDKIPNDAEKFSEPKMGDDGKKYSERTFTDPKAHTTNTITYNDQSMNMSGKPSITQHAAIEMLENYIDANFLPGEKIDIKMDLSRPGLQQVFEDAAEKIGRDITITPTTPKSDHENSSEKSKAAENASTDSTASATLASDEEAAVEKEGPQRTAPGR